MGKAMYKFYIDAYTENPANATHKRIDWRYSQLNTENYNEKKEPN